VLTRSGHDIAPPARSHSATSLRPATTSVCSHHQQCLDLLEDENNSTSGKEEQSSTSSGKNSCKDSHKGETGTANTDTNNDSSSSKISEGSNANDSSNRDTMSVDNSGDDRADSCPAPRMTVGPKTTLSVDNTTTIANNTTTVANDSTTVANDATVANDNATIANNATVANNTTIANDTTIVANTTTIADITTVANAATISNNTITVAGTAAGATMSVATVFAALATLGNVQISVQVFWSMTTSPQMIVLYVIKVFHFILVLCMLLNLLLLDIQMNSPPPLSRYELQGASCTTGGIFRGRAYGNNLNIADLPDEDDTLILIIGKIYLYITADNPATLDLTTMKWHIVILVKGGWRPYYQGPHRMSSKFIIRNYFITCLDL